MITYYKYDIISILSPVAPTPHRSTSNWQHSQKLTYRLHPQDHMTGSESERSCCCYLATTPNKTQNKRQYITRTNHKTIATNMVTTTMLFLTYPTKFKHSSEHKLALHLVNSTMHQGWLASIQSMLN